MKAKLYLFSIALLVSGGAQSQINPSSLPFKNFNNPIQSATTFPPQEDADWYAAACNNLEASQYDFQRLPSRSYAALNINNKMRFDIDPKGYSVSSLNRKDQASWQTAFHLESITRDDNKWIPSHPSIEAQGSFLRIRDNYVDMEFTNNTEGLRQNFFIKNKLNGTGNLSIHLNLGSKMHYEVTQQNKLLCYSIDSTKKLRLLYDSLKVWDANGQPLTAFMKLSKRQVLTIVVDDKNAVYPLTVDPLNHTPEWITSANGLLPGLLTNLQLQVDALYAMNVTALGDVNGDGFDDVAIGAPGAIDIISGPGTLLGAGAVFIYYGSATGLPVTPSKTLRSTTPVVNALFGFSIAAGNVAGDSRNDIVIGAPGESYSASVGGFPKTATVTAGKVYLVRGEDLAATNPSPFLSVYLNGSTFFSRGVLGLVGSNISVNALFGFSVGVTEDMNGDGLGEIIVGAPGYAELALLPVTSGAALVYYSSQLASNTPVKLTAPSTALLGVPLVNTGGLLFGFSVDGVGDYNQDGHPDLVVGAPAGLTISLGNLLGGSAYVYYGTGSGVNTTPGTQLSAKSSLLDNIANLFGYSVRGLRNAAGERNGNILIGAPSGNLLSNVLNGLSLKTGSVNVFVHKTSPGSSRVPDQQIASPRGNSLLTILTGNKLEVSALFGVSIDNMLDVNCDGINDIIVGEPLSTSAGILSANALGGAADIFLGKADGTFESTPTWTLENTTSMDLGINAGSLLGFSVAGARHVRGPLQGVRALVGAPGAALDFSSGVLALGNTLGTLFSFAAGNNGLGKALLFGFNNCGAIYNPDFNATYINIPVPGNVSTNDKVPAGTLYGTPVADPGNPSVGTIVMFNDGSYTFTANVPGVYLYQVPVCLPGSTSGCEMVELKITVLSASSLTNPPVANTDIAATHSGHAVIIHSLANDHCSNPGCSLNTSGVAIVTPPSHGTATVNPATGDVTYTPAAGFIGKDTLVYRVCDNGTPQQCATASQIVTVSAIGSVNSTMAADDYNMTIQGMSVTGNVSYNDSDPEGDAQSVTPQTINLPNIGLLTLDATGNYELTPSVNFSGPMDWTYTTCDNGNPTACASATLHILVKANGILPISLTDFHYEVKDCGVKLFWSVAQQEPIQDFVVENSTDGKNFSQVGMVVANGKNSNTNSYQFVPQSPASGRHYYRLMIRDREGRFQYSQIISPVISCSNPVVTVLPNPFMDRITIRYRAEKSELVQVTLTDGTGKVIVNTTLQAQEGGNNLLLKQLGNLSSGVYILSIRTSEKVTIQKLLK